MQGIGCFTPNQIVLCLLPAHNLLSKTGHSPPDCLQTGHGVVTPIFFRSQAVLLGWNRSKCIERVTSGGEDPRPKIAFMPNMKRADRQILLRPSARREMGLIHRHHQCPSPPSTPAVPSPPMPNSSVTSPSMNGWPSQTHTSVTSPQTLTSEDSRNLSPGIFL